MVKIKAIHYPATAWRHLVNFHFQMFPYFFLFIDHRRMKIQVHVWLHANKKEKLRLNLNFFSNTKCQLFIQPFCILKMYEKLSCKAMAVNNNNNNEFIIENNVYMIEIIINHNH
ncbi:hypothetical protein DERP_005826 [Dermatophagoides pteronyssinus]|uniref:Uncharacterized protein n=1 Tax=Dermatophagoides pteronyssinus TaxID=6956 RepID=A0ABQ8J9N2_DERPT|nr:hypothetical protein DERP_005826 [Dermatophagoides pteronyssinus]